jgi:hypothetical protein
MDSIPAAYPSQRKLSTFAMESNDESRGRLWTYVFSGNGKVGGGMWPVPTKKGTMGALQCTHP